MFLTYEYSSLRHLEMDPNDELDLRRSIHPFGVRLFFFILLWRKEGKKEDMKFEFSSNSTGNNGNDINVKNRNENICNTSRYSEIHISRWDCENKEKEKVQTSSRLSALENMVTGFVTNKNRSIMKNLSLCTRKGHWWGVVYLKVFRQSVINRGRQNISWI